ncbi:BPTI/Kunitz domain-containing protein-like [Vanessa cardui]|uniref:BPTI/Kunitz domain-containing protein-like n=1 Tax=Vanessa cardui TaxID=171605 RepID=UPI001F147F24|nr:BPTI/Kunitz domain-containing protein-like [Vanessa cardui]
MTCREHLKLFVLVIIIYILLITYIKCHRKPKRYKFLTTQNPNEKKICLKYDQTIKARHKTCFLRPDTGPCRADILQWYYDVRQAKCYRFFWGGCQGNGNRFDTKLDCENYCHLNKTNSHGEIPQFCSLAFDYGSCFGYFNRWAWDSLTKTCRRRMYSGCGGNQNNFQTRLECISTCLNPPNNTFGRSHIFTTCIPIVIDELH